MTLGQQNAPCENRAPIPVEGRVLITHDWLVAWGGAERVLDELAALFTDADIVTAIRRESVALEHSTAHRALELWPGKLPGARNHHHWFLPIEALAFFELSSEIGRAHV